MKFEMIAGMNDNKYQLKKGMFAGYYLERSTGVFSDEEIKLEGNLITFEQLTEENKSSFLAKAGWGALGSLVLGPIGLAAGLFFAGNEKEITVAGELKDGQKFLAKVDKETFDALKALTYK